MYGEVANEVHGFLAFLLRAKVGKKLDTGYWMLDTGYWILDTGCWMLDAGYGIPNSLLDMTTLSS